VLAFAARDLDDAAMSAAIEDPMAAVQDLIMVALVGIIDPLRTEARDAVRTALAAGIDVRMITGDHTVTARAIADQLGLGPGVLTGTELQRLPDEEVVRQLPDLHVFGRVAPEDKLRLAKLMQQSGDVVAMTGDAVNDAAALKQADIGVATGSGSEISKQAAKIVLTDDNFATLVRAVDLGRDIYRRITSYVKLQLTILSSVLQLMLLATIFNVKRRRRAVPHAAAVLQVLRRGDRRDRVHRRRSGPERHAATTAQARHEDRQPAPNHPLGAERPDRRGPLPPRRSFLLLLGFARRPVASLTEPAVGANHHGTDERDAPERDRRRRAQRVLGRRDRARPLQLGDDEQTQCDARQQRAEEVPQHQPHRVRQNHHHRRCRDERRIQRGRQRQHEDVAHDRRSG